MIIKLEDPISNNLDVGNNEVRNFLANGFQIPSMCST